MTPATVPGTEPLRALSDAHRRPFTWAGDQSALILANGFIYTDNESGTFALLHASETLEVVAVNKLGDCVRATPAIGGDTLYVRSAGKLWAFGARPSVKQ